MIQLKLTRRKYTGNQTIGTIDVFKDNVFISSFCCLERGWLNNKLNQSCIPKGNYIVKHYNSNAHPNTFVVEGTHPRTGILIHKGNFYTDSAGCIILGLMFTDLNNDKFLDVKYSTEAMNKLNDICKGEEIINLDIL